MKLQNEIGKQQHPRRKSRKIFPLIFLTLFLTIITIYYPSLKYHTINRPKKASLLFTPSSSFSDFDLPGVNITSAVDDVSVEPITNPVAKIVLEKTEKREKKRRGKRRRKRDHVTKPPPPPPPPVEMDDDEGDGEGGGGGGGGGRLVDSSELLKDKKCNLYSGEWIKNLEGPYYTNQTCFAIQEHQNCMKFGRPDREFLKWKWKPDGCDLPVFNPSTFLKIVSGKSLAFVGDSVARNHMQSLICLLSTVAIPVTVSSPFEQNQRHEYRDYNFTMSIFWAPYLVRAEKTDPENVTLPFNLYLDEFDEDWRSKIGEYDYVIISGGQWFFRPTNFFLNRRFVGCLYCSYDNNNNITHYNSAAFSYRRAFRTAFRAIYSSENYKGLTILRTYATSHFENGRWDAGGDCQRTGPYKRNEAPPMEDYSLEMYSIQLQEFQIAEKEAKKRGLRFRLFDATKPMFLRPDGHPSKYGHWPKANVTLANDCVHWCLPGPIDTLNDFLLELMKREEEEDE